MTTTFCNLRRYSITICPLFIGVGPQYKLVAYAYRSRDSWGHVFAFVCLCVCLFFWTISQNVMHLGSPNSTKCSTISARNSFIWGSKGQR